MIDRAPVPCFPCKYTVKLHFNYLKCHKMSSVDWLDWDTVVSSVHSHLTLQLTTCVNSRSEQSHSLRPVYTKQPQGPVQTGNNIHLIRCVDDTRETWSLGPQSEEVWAPSFQQCECKHVLRHFGRPTTSLTCLFEYKAGSRPGEARDARCELMCFHQRGHMGMPGQWCRESGRSSSPQCGCKVPNSQRQKPDLNLDRWRNEDWPDCPYLKKSHTVGPRRNGSAHYSHTASYSLFRFWPFYWR